MRPEPSALYAGVVVHRRMKPVAHLLRYRVFSLLLDLDTLPDLGRRLRLFGHNRAALFSFYDRDHGDGSGRPLRPQIEAHLAEAGLDLNGGPIRVLCYPRLLGHVFNPLTVYYCHHSTGPLVAMVYEVSNTFGQRHSYVLPVPEEAKQGVVRHACDKAFFVSPFIGMEARYHFRLKPPGDDILVTIHETDAEGPLLNASFSGQRQPLNDKTLLAAFFRYPLMTLKVVGGIHWEALRLWRKGVPLHQRPPAPPRAVTVAALVDHT